MEFKISKELIQQLENLIQSKNIDEIEILLNDLHPSFSNSKESSSSAR